MRQECAICLASLDSLRRTKLMEDLLVERALRKSDRVLEIWEASDCDWNQTLYHLGAYAIGAPRNGGQMEELARRVQYLMCLKERSSLRRVEALLLGCSGLLNMEFFDDHIVALQDEYEYLAGKYSLSSMHAGVWDRSSLMPAGTPVIRIAQFAALVAKDEFAVDAIVALRSLEDVERMFSVRASEYWRTRCVPGGKKFEGSGRIGRQKIHMLAINLVVPLQFAYATVTKNEPLKERALELLEAIPAEKNRVVSGWTGYGVACTSAYDSQALLELSAKCDRGECAGCPMAKMVGTRVVPPTNMSEKKEL